jgi:hypothetical protein
MDLILLSTFFQQKPDANRLEIGAMVQEILHFLNLKQKRFLPCMVRAGRMGGVKDTDRVCAFACILVPPYIYILGTFNTFIHKTFFIVSRIVLIISCCVLDRGGIVLIRRYVQVHARLTTLLVGEGCNRICTTSNNVGHKVVMVVIHLE